MAENTQGGSTGQSAETGARGASDMDETMSVLLDLLAGSQDPANREIAGAFAIEPSNRALALAAEKRALETRDNEICHIPCSGPLQALAAAQLARKAGCDVKLAGNGLDIRHGDVDVLVAALEDARAAAPEGQTEAQGVISVALEDVNAAAVKAADAREANLETPTQTAPTKTPNEKKDQPDTQLNADADKAGEREPESEGDGRDEPAPAMESPVAEVARGRDIAAESMAAQRREDIGNTQTTADYVQSRPNTGDQDPSTPYGDCCDAPGLGDSDGDGVMDSAEDRDGDGTPDDKEAPAELEPVDESQRDVKRLAVEKTAEAAHIEAVKGAKEPALEVVSR